MTEDCALTRRKLGHDGENGTTENSALSRTVGHEGEHGTTENYALAMRTIGHEGEQGKLENYAMARRTMTKKENKAGQRTIHWQG